MVALQYQSAGILAQNTCCFFRKGFIGLEA